MEEPNIGFTIVKEVVDSFLDCEEIIELLPINQGLLNKSYKVVAKINGEISSFFLQEINTAVWKKPESIIENIFTVANHLKKNNYPNGLLIPIANKAGSYTTRLQNTSWRLFPFIENSYSLDYIEHKKQAFDGGFSFGQYLGLLTNLSIDQINIILPDFHHPNKRYDSFLQSVEADKFDLKSSCEMVINGLNEFAFLLDYNWSAHRQRVTHNDLKISNLLFDKTTHEILAIVDLDTLMPGYLIFDFGDLVRSFTNQSEDDDKFDLVKMDLEIFEELSKGFMKGIGNGISESELDGLVEGCLLICFEQSLRFLTDHLNGNEYYNVKYPTHNLIRAQNQLALLEDMYKKSDQMRLYLQKIA